ncbi:mannuronate-specific alginate lyase [Aquipseudomonas ullengensis]|uniref:Mannuronate-specific alginate lyase n=1 Tax=Aquipseudomonas ullengensis TaxID=2759166 RepID=A0A7W4LMY7_9GAMM|nr:mannuronate-specific alginate lyase [Pseudomonas ullengensis]MBB2496146.1 mannuronate-specific alginate lyase [Pseudomonas ullengensis]
MRVLQVIGLAVLLGLGQGCSWEHDGRATLVPPGGYLLSAAEPQGKPRSCPAVPTPYTGELYFPSKYSGSGAARDKINSEAAARYAQLTDDVRLLENGSNRLVARYLETGQQAYADCVVTWLHSWADADALLSERYNHTGKSVRKWALGSVSGAYLRLKFSRSQPLKRHADEAERIEEWLGELADQVVVDWNAQPMDRRNNHQYWAAWSVMATAVVLDRHDLFDWSVAQYRHGMQQVDAEGYLPLELSRQTRALAYHNYSMGPLLMIAAFAQANGLDLRKENSGALQRLAQRMESGLRDPKIFQEKTGYPQTLEDLQEKNRFAWLEPYCALYPCSESTQAWRRSIEPLGTYRLGGDMTQLFSRHLP